MRAKTFFKGAPRLVRLLALLVGVGATFAYFIAAVILLSDGVVKAKSGSCCLPQFCNPYALPPSTVASWASGGMCLFPPDQAAAMGCANAEMIPVNCSVTNADICKTQSGKGTTLATGIIGIILAVFGGGVILGAVFRRIALVSVLGSLGLGLTITEIILGSFVFHWQLNEQIYTFDVAYKCDVYVSNTCVSYKYADWQFKSGTCVIAGTHSYVFGWNIAPDSLTRPAAVLLFVPVAVLFFGIVLFISALVCRQRLDEVMDALENNSQTSSVAFPVPLNETSNEQKAKNEIYGREPAEAALTEPLNIEGKAV